MTLNFSQTDIDTVLLTNITVIVVLIHPYQLLSYCKHLEKVDITGGTCN